MPGLSRLIRHCAVALFVLEIVAVLVPAFAALLVPVIVLVPAAEEEP